MAIALSGCKSTSRQTTVWYSREKVVVAAPFAPGIISTKENSEFDLTFSPDGLKAYFSRRAPEQKQKIYETSFRNGQWSEPVLCTFSTGRDEAPSLTPNGQKFFFGSERPIPGKPNLGNFDMNIWMMDNTPSGWSEPVPLPFPINEVQIAGEEWPSSNNSFLFAADNETFLFTTMKRGEKAISLYQTTWTDGTFSEPVEIRGLFDDERLWVYSAVISPDGKYLLFNSFGAPGGSGGEDIFVSKRTGSGWSRAKPIGQMVNSKNEDAGPRFSRDGKYFFFSRSENLGNDTYGEWDIFYIETQYLNLEKLFE